MNTITSSFQPSTRLTVAGPSQKQPVQINSSSRFFAPKRSLHQDYQKMCLFNTNTLIKNANKQ